MKKVARITEEDLRRIVGEAVNNILQNEETLNEGWKNWIAAGALGAATLFGNPQKADAQNRVVDSFKTPTEMSQQKGSQIDKLLLDPSKSIKENYNVIRNFINQNKNNNYIEYTILVDGHYVNKKNEFYDWHIGEIKLKGKDNEFYRTIDGSIIHTLTNLYSHALDEKFDVPANECDGRRVNEKTVSVPSGRYIKHSNGTVSKEYVRKTITQNTLYSLSEFSSLYKQIYNKVIQETGLKDGGSLYDSYKELENWRKNPKDAYKQRQEKIKQEYERRFGPLEKPTEQESEYEKKYKELLQKRENYKNNNIN